MLNILLFIFILGVLVFVHELGHFLAAIKSGVRVDEFAIGFPPNLYSYHKDGINYQINLIPFGGYVKIHGEDGDDVNNPRSFASKNTLTKIFIISAGVLMNFLLGALVLSVVFMLGMPVSSQSPYQDYPYSQVKTEVYVYDVPTDNINNDIIQTGDQIVAVNNQPIKNIVQFKTAIQSLADQPYSLTITRKKQEMDLNVSSAFNQNKNEWQLGIDLIEGHNIKYPFYLAIPMGFVEMCRMTWMMISALIMIVRELIISHTAPSTITGPIGIYKITTEASSMGLVYVLQLISILSINLGIINYLPLPALDGGRVWFILGEKIFGKKISAQTENIIHLIGFIAIISILIIVTIGDVQRYF